MFRPTLRFASWTVILLLLVAPAPTSEAQSCPVKTDYAPVAGVDLAISNGHVYVATGTDLLVFDASDPSDLVQVSQWLYPAQGIEVVSDTVYVASAHDFVVLNVSDPSNPTEVDRLVDPFGETIRPWFGVSGEYAFLAYPTSPYLLAVIGLTPSLNVVNPNFASSHSVMDLLVDGDALFVSSSVPAMGETVIAIYDISTPSAPVQAGGLIFDGYSLAMAVENDLLYVSAREVYDVSNPSFPVQIGVFDAWGSALDANGIYLHVFGDDLYTFNVADPQVPVELGSIPTLDPATRIVSDGNILASLSNAAGLEVFDIVNCEWAMKPDCNLDGVIDGADISCILRAVY